MTTTYEKIATTTLGSAAASVTFSTISGSYTDLVLICAAPSTSGAITIDKVFLNNDTGSNYSTTRLSGNGTSASSDRQSNTTALPNGLSYPGQFTQIYNFMNYSNTTTYKTILSKSAVAQSLYRTSVGLWRNTAAITTIKIEDQNNTYIAGSTFTLYGIKAE